MNRYFPRAVDDENMVLEDPARRLIIGERLLFFRLFPSKVHCPRSGTRRELSPHHPFALIPRPSTSEQEVPGVRLYRLALTACAPTRSRAGVGPDVL